MIRSRVTSGVVAALASGLAAAISFAAVYAASPGIRFEMDRTLPAAVSGVFPPERDGDLTFAWTGADAQLSLPGLNRRVPWVCTASIRTWRPGGAPLPVLRFSVDGLEAVTWQTRTAIEEVRVPIPAQTDRSGLTLRLSVSSTFQPGPEDPRELGIVLDALSCNPEAGGLVLPPAGAWLRSAGAAAVLAAAAALTGLPLTFAVLFGLLAALLGAWPLAFGLAPYFPARPPAVALAAGLAIAVLAAAGAAHAVRRQPWSTMTLAALAASAVAMYLKLLVLLHPSMPPMDAVFQAHRLEWVLAGKFYFTSLTPDGYLFPYGISLYLAAAPFALLTHDYVALLRVVVVAAEALAGVLLYAMIARTWNDRRAAIAALLIFHTTLIAQGVIGTANLTNAFGESMALAAIASLVLLPPSAPLWLPVLVAGALASIAFVAHFSTLVVLTGALGLIAIAYRLWGGPPLWQMSTRVLLGLGVALVVSTLAFYGHFMPTYRSQLERLTGEVSAMTGVPAGGGSAQGTAAAPAPGASRAAARRGRPSLGVRVETMTRRTRQAYGLVLPAMALAGLVSLARRRVRDRLSLAVAGWLLTLTAFSALAVLTPLEMRYHLAVAPALACLAGVCVSDLWRAGGWPRIGVAVAALAVMVDGARAWYSWIL